MKKPVLKWVTGPNRISSIASCGLRRLIILQVRDDTQYKGMWNPRIPSLQDVYYADVEHAQLAVERSVEDEAKDTLRIFKAARQRTKGK